MNLLALTNNPERSSFRQRFGVYLNTFQEKGIDCEVVKLPSGYPARYKVFARAKNFHGVLLHKKMLNAIDAFWLRRFSRKIIFNFDDAIMYSDKHPNRMSLSHYLPWRRTVKMSDMVLVGGSHLASLTKKYNQNVNVL